MKPHCITDIKSLEVIDNRGNPTIRTYVSIDDHYLGQADVPCGSSTGEYEARELRDSEERFRGLGVRRAIANIEEVIKPRLLGMRGTDQRQVDRLLLEMDGTPDKSGLGANAILGVSLAVAQAAAKACGLPLYRYLNATAQVLPVPQACLMNGGLHAGNDLDIQEYCVMPVGADNFAHGVQMLCEIFWCLKDLLLTRIGKVAINSSEDGGFAPPLKESSEAMAYLTEAVSTAGYADQIVYALDFAASGFFDSKAQRYHFEGSAYTSEEMLAYIAELTTAFPGIVSIEDVLHENDIEGWRLATTMFKDLMLVGDDLFATNINRLRLGVKENLANAALCKVNQIGSLTEALDAARFGQRNGYPIVMSVRSGETEDDILSDISVALDAGLFKTGGIRGSDRGANYNRFLEIEAELGSRAVYAGSNYSRLK